MIYKVAATRRKNKQDVAEVGVIKDGNGNILIEGDKIIKRWAEYFSQLLNTENVYEELEDIPLVGGPIAHISRSEVEYAIKRKSW